MRKKNQRGYSLIELMIVVILLLVMMAAVFQVINQATARSGTEQAKLDMFQESREFMDQMSRDLHQAGYPSTQNFASNVITQSPAVNDHLNAVGLVKVDTGDLWFEGDVDGTGVVYSIQYHLDTSTANGCPCLRRSQQVKINGNPLTGQTAATYEVEVQGVQNTNIFTAFLHGATGTPVTLPVDFNTDGPTIANIDTIEAVVTIKSNHLDAQTRKFPTTSLISTVRMNNCSQGDTGQDMSCQ